MIRNLVFDVGNVLLGYRTPELMRETGVTDAQYEQIVQHVFANPLWNELDRGVRPFAEVVEEMCAGIPDLREKVFWLIDHSVHMKVDRPEVWERVQKLKEKGYRIYLLSNYAEPFYDTQFRDAPFMAWIDGAVISFRVHLLKPDPTIYRELTDRYGLRSDECLFFDDLEANVRAAALLGFETFRVTSASGLIKKLDELLEAEL